MHIIFILYQSESLVCGVNSVAEELQKGENENCRIFSATGRKCDNYFLQYAQEMNPVTGLNPSRPETPYRRRTQMITRYILFASTKFNIEVFQKVTVLSPDGTLLAVAGTHNVRSLSSLRDTSSCSILAVYLILPSYGARCNAYSNRERNL